MLLAPQLAQHSRRQAAEVICVELDSNRHRRNEHAEQGLQMPHPPGAVRVALVEKLQWPPAPFQSPGMGLGSKVTSML